LRAKTKQLEGKVSETLTARNGHSDPASQAEIDTVFKKIAILADVIENGASRAARIVSDLKTFSHPGTEAPAPFDLHESLDMCLNLLANQMKHRVTVQKNYGDVDEIYGPRSQLNQVFMNILNNAQQAIGEKGEITITTRRDADRVTISIRDTGHGIPEAIKGRIFDPFFTTKDPGVGTGLGLSISYSVVQGLGGTIECNSQVGQGTEFVISLPATGSAQSGDPRGHRSVAGMCAVQEG
jgi:signal transduction histidine kinase